MAEYRNELLREVTVERFLSQCISQQQISVDQWCYHSLETKSTAGRDLARRQRSPLSDGGIGVVVLPKVRRKSATSDDGFSGVPPPNENKILLKHFLDEIRSYWQRVDESIGEMESTRRAMLLGRGRAKEGGKRDGNGGRFSLSTGDSSFSNVDLCLEYTEILHNLYFFSLRSLDGCHGYSSGTSKLKKGPCRYIREDQTHPPPQVK